MGPIEEQILGAVLDAEGPALKTAAGVLLDLSGLQPGDFRESRVRVAWTIAQRLAERRRPVDAQTVFAAGLSTRAFEPDALAWMAGLQASNALDRERFADLAEVVRSTRARDRLAAALREGLEALARKDAQTAEVVAAVESALQDAAGALTLAAGDGSEDVLEIASDWERAENDPSAPPVLVPTGLKVLDEEITGFPSNLTVIAGLPSVGKSALLGSIIDAQLDMGLTVGLFGLEDGTRWLSKRLIARDLQMAVREVGHTRREGERAERFPEVAQRLHQKLKRLVCFRRDTVTAGEMLRLATVWKVRHQIGVLYVDHGGEVDHTHARLQDADHRLRVAETYRLIRNWALRHQTPAVVLSHTIRPQDDNEERPPRASEIAETAYIERRARLILGVWARLKDPGHMRLTVLKQTEGERNVTVRLRRLTHAALLDRTEGGRVNLQAERALESRETKEERAREAQAIRDRVRAERETKKEPPPPPPERKPDEPGQKGLGL